MTDHAVQILAEDVIAIPCDTASTAQALSQHLRDQSDWIDVVPGLESVAVRFDPAKTSPSVAETRLRRALEAAPKSLPITDAVLSLPARYGGAHGPELTQICEQLGLSQEAFIKRHSAKPYPVEMIGFTPGFAYLGGLDASLSVPRLGTPKPRIAAGSIGISGLFTGIYALPGPGGWPIIARTDIALFDPSKNDPFTIRPGLQIRFEPQ